jgi:hypothetical protein
MNQKISEKYRHNCDGYETDFPAAHRFLIALENGAPHGLWLSTATNAHLYKRDAFLSYIRFGNVQHANPTLILSPHFHIAIAEAASDEAHLLFPIPILQILNKHTVGHPSWWDERPGNSFELRNTTPSAFFDDLLALLRRIEVPLPPIASTRPAPASAAAPTSAKTKFQFLQKY